jgi:hypothetical protein
MRFDGKSTPLVLILMAGHVSLVVISPPGELKRMVCFATTLDVMNECHAPELNKTVVGCDLVRNIPKTASGAY